METRAEGHKAFINLDSYSANLWVVKPLEQSLPSKQLNARREPKMRVTERYSTREVELIQLSQRAGRAAAYPIGFDMSDLPLERFYRELALKALENGRLPKRKTPIELSVTQGMLEKVSPSGYQVTGIALAVQKKGSL